MAEPLSAEELDEIERQPETSRAIVLRLIAMARRDSVVCPDCSGAGYLHWDAEYEHFVQQTWQDMSHNEDHGRVEPCDECRQCGTCHGDGAVWKEGA